MPYEINVTLSCQVLNDDNKEGEQVWDTREFSCWNDDDKEGRRKDELESPGKENIKHLSLSCIPGQKTTCSVSYSTVTGIDSTQNYDRQ